MNDLLNKTFLNCEKYFKNNKIEYRISKIDNFSFCLRSDMRINRVNLHLKSNKNFKESMTIVNDIMEYIEKNKDKITVIKLENF